MVGSNYSNSGFDITYHIDSPAPGCKVYYILVQDIISVQPDDVIAGNSRCAGSFPGEDKRTHTMHVNCKIENDKTYKLYIQQDKTCNESNNRIQSDTRFFPFFKLMHLLIE